MPTFGRSPYVYGGFYVDLPVVYGTVVWPVVITVVPLLRCVRYRTLRYLIVVFSHITLLYATVELDVVTFELTTYVVIGYVGC